MKKTILLIAVLASSLSFAQDKCCNVITSNGENVITKNEECVITSNIDSTACLDQDGDGVIDSEDKCPETPGTANGCPDADKDGVIDSEDKCPETPGTVNGCPDTDKDGVIDSKDKCPNVAGTVKGCPDSDKDGVIDSKDKCPNVAGTVKGCPDSDKDGVIDSKDKCPNVAGPINGCPKADELSNEEASVLGKYAKTIKFNTGKFSFKQGISNTLDKIAQVMNKHKEINFEIDGYTDSSGNKAKNLKLSQDRAQAVVDYLASHGIDRSRLIAKGFGIEKPIATNKTAAGRAENRRVEIVAQH